MEDMKERLDEELKDPTRSVEEQERTIEYVSMPVLLAACVIGSAKRLMIFRILIDLEQTDEPAWAYLDYQHAHILETMKAIFKTASEQARGLSSHCFFALLFFALHADLVCSRCPAMCGDAVFIHVSDGSVEATVVLAFLSIECYPSYVAFESYILGRGLSMQLLLSMRPGFLSTLWSSSFLSM